MNTTEPISNIVTVDMLEKRLQKTLNDLNAILGKFQQDLIQSQVRTNLVWNSMNAVLKCWLDKGVITAKEIEEAGVILMQEAKENMLKAKESIEKKEALDTSKLAATPLDMMKSLLYPPKPKIVDSNGHELHKKS